MKRLASFLCVSGLLVAPGCLNQNSKSAPDVSEPELPQRTAEVICGLLFDCDCQDNSYADETACIDAISMQVSAQSSIASSQGLTYDASCAGASVAQWEDIACSTTYSESSSCEVCKVYYGSVAKGGTCTPGATGLDDCAQGLWCNSADGTTYACEDPCEMEPYLGLDEPCWDMATTTSLGNCDYDAGLYCDVTATGTCLASVGAGEPCPNFVECGQGLTCDFTTDPANPVCVSPPPLPGIGEPCPGFVCEVGATCDTQTDPMNPVCVANEPLVCFQGGQP